MTCLPRTKPDAAGSVRIPQTSPRGTRTAHAKLIERVNPSVFGGFAFEGQFLKPGARILIPESGPVVLLECVGSRRLGEDGRPARKGNPAVYDYRLWRYNRDGMLWHELGRSNGTSWEWTLDLAPMAQRALQEARAVVSIPEALARLQSLIDAELRDLELHERSRLVALLYDHVAQWAVA